MRNFHWGEGLLWEVGSRSWCCGITKPQPTEGQRQDTREK